jgi:glutamyl-tRNA synthetase
MSVVTRIAPSPTGYLHFGLARTALFNYLFARKEGGKFIMRIEDTDAARNKAEYEDDIREQMTWLGLEADAVYRQSEHRTRHEECLQKLIQEDKAYVSVEPAKDDPSRMVSVVRLRNSGEVITFTDLIRGEITFDTSELKDFVIARSVSEPLYHLAVVIDDEDEGVTHVIRGEDHISNTPRQILIARALGFAIPIYAHLPLILMPDKSKMSKRKHESSVKHFREIGIVPEALINYVALLGWNPGSDRELFTLPELVEAFDIAHIQKSGAVFDFEKLRWFNRHYIHSMPDEAFAEEAMPRFKEGIQSRNIAWDEKIAERLIHLLKERISTWGDIGILIADGEFDYFFQKPELDSKRIPDRKSGAEIAQKHLIKIAEFLRDVTEFSEENIKDAVWDYASSEGRAAVLWPFRYALTGAEKSPDPFTTSAILGKDETISRVKEAIGKLHI